MNEQKQRIADFIEKSGAELVDSSTILLGGAKKEQDGVLTAENNGSCTNVSYDACNGATNGGDCKNQAYMCNKSTNRGSCDNSYGVVVPINPNGSC